MPFSSPTVSFSSNWLSAQATYHTASDPGYGETHGASAALSVALFESSPICGACCELRCAEEVQFDRRWCVSRATVVVTAATFCGPNYGMDAEDGGGGGLCNPPKQHFVLPVKAVVVLLMSSRITNDIVNDCRSWFLYISGKSWQKRHLR